MAEKNVHIQARIPESMRSEFQKVAESKAQVPSMLIRNWIENYIKENEEELKMTNFKNVGTWWNDKEVELMEIDGKVYALSGWNGEKYLDSWEVAKNDYTDIINDGITIKPEYKEVEEDEFEIVGYTVE